MFVFICLLTASLLCGTTTLKDVYIVGLYPFEGAWRGGPAMLAASQLAVEHVNQRGDILPGYTLNLLWNDTKVRIWVALTTSPPLDLTS